MCTGHFICCLISALNFSAICQTSVRTKGLMTQLNMFVLLVSLCVCVLCSRSNAQTSDVQYESGAYTSSCTEICSASDLLCADSMIESMSCSAVAKWHCGISSMTSNSNIGCTVSGCYVNCQDSYYYSKTSSFSSCNTAGTCLTSSSNLAKFCPCYAATTSTLEGWATAGLYLAGGIAAIAVVAAVVKVRAKMRSDNSDHESLDTSASDYDLESTPSSDSGSGGVAEGGTSQVAAALSGFFGGEKEGGDDGGGKKVKRKKKVTRYRTKLPLETEMDETRDMAIA